MGMEGLKIEEFRSPCRAWLWVATAQAKPHGSLSRVIRSSYIYYHIGALQKKMFIREVFCLYGFWSMRRCIVSIQLNFYAACKAYFWVQCKQIWDQRRRCWLHFLLHSNSYMCCVQHVFRAWSVTAMCREVLQQNFSSHAILSSWQNFADYRQKVIHRFIFKENSPCLLNPSVTSVSCQVQLGFKEDHITSQQPLLKLWSMWSRQQLSEVVRHV